ncbi:DUF3833 domain-containing protein [Hydromonas duriensis]|uniref:Uncharacterized protein DUF3833 n=1 Tax=Hydromonas duriensis TaxID=1527608 RepID=A0A4R6Y5E1_9BURK|nr:DUF3833 domain-containing protein [Hydromonas duriensis]TDR27838.1 uncharacterized protein DUF3833 [Hydromonas duriensis]
MKKILLAVMAGLLFGCAAPEVSQYQQAEPKLDLVQYFVGKTDAWGMFQKRNGEVVKRFHVEITGTYQNEQLVLDERFDYADGTKQQRVWTLKQAADGSWRGTAADVKGEAIGQIAGNALNWNYTMLLPVDGSTYEVQFDDWMFLMDAHTLLNRAKMTKFGFELGQVTLFFKKRE